jgi:hypothetical protein
MRLRMTAMLGVLLVFEACSTSSEGPSPAGPSTEGGQSGTDSSGEQGEVCVLDEDTKAESVAMDATIEGFGASPEDIAAPLRERRVLRCNDLGCDSTLVVEITPLSKPTVAIGQWHTFEGGIDLTPRASAEACTRLTIPVKAHVSSSDGTVEFSPTEAIATRSSIAVLEVSGRGQVDGVEQELSLAVVYVGLPETKAVDGVISNSDGEVIRSFTWTPTGSVDTGGAGGAADPGNDLAAGAAGLVGD